MEGAERWLADAGQVEGTPRPQPKVVPIRRVTTTLPASALSVDPVSLVIKPSTGTVIDEKSPAMPATCDCVSVLAITIATAPAANAFAAFTAKVHAPRSMITTFPTTPSAFVRFVHAKGGSATMIFALMMLAARDA
jgi:hypothetical protein